MARVRELFGSLTLPRLAEAAYRNWRQVVAGVVIAVLGLGGWMGYAWYRMQREHEASAAMTRAFAEIRKHEGAKEREEAATTQFRAVAKEYPGTPTGGEALIRLGNRLYEAGKYDDAREAFARYVQDHRRGPLWMMAALGKAYAEEAKGDLAAAEGTLTGAIDRGKGDPLLGEAELALGRIYEGLKRMDDALRIYGQVAERFPQTRWSQYALDRMASLKSK